MLCNPLFQRSFEESDGLFQRHVILLFCDGVLDNLQRFGINRFRNHFIGTLERIDGVYQIDAQFVYIDKPVGNLNHPVALAGSVVIVCDGRNGITFLVHDVISFDNRIEQHTLAHLLHLTITQFRIALAYHLGYQVLRNRLCRRRAAECFHHHVVLQNGCFQVVKLTFHNGLCLYARQRFQTFHHKSPDRTLPSFGGVGGGFKLPTWSHHLFHQQRGCNRFQEVVYGHLHFSLFSLWHGNHIYKSGSFLTLAVARTSSYNLYHLRQRATHANSQTHLAPLPVEAFLCSSKSDNDVHIVAAFHLLQIVLHHVALFLLILHEVGHFQHSPVICPDIVNACIVVLILYDTYHLQDFCRFLILAQASSCPLIHAGYVDDGLFPRVKHFAYMVQVRAMIEVVAQHEILQILIAIQLLVIVIGDGTESGFILCPEHRDAVATEVTARHGHDMPSRVVHHPAHHIA